MLPHLRSVLLSPIACLLGLLSPLAAAALPAEILVRDGVLNVSFQPANAPVSGAVLTNAGEAYSQDKGMGWDKDLTHQIRLRKSGSHGVCLLSTAITDGEFTIDLPDGDYLFEATSDDTDYAGVLAPMIGGELVGYPVSYGAGSPVSVVVPVTSVGGKARIGFTGGRTGMGNTVVSTIRITKAADRPDAWKLAVDTMKERQEAIRAERAYRQAKRARERAAYSPVVLRDTKTPSHTYDLSGRWLFTPCEDPDDAAAGSNPSVSDASWHTIMAPQSWKPINWWIFMGGRGQSHNFFRRELRRCQDLTFDYGGTNTGWYRHWIEVPASMSGKRMVLKFDAVASIAAVYWNGKLAGSHVGMFGPFECDVTPYVKYGDKNLLSVLVSASKPDDKASKEVAAVAVTMEITKDMLTSLPHGGYFTPLAGIWQPVRLEVSEADRVADVFFNPRLDGAEILTTVGRATNAALTVKHTIVDAATGKTLYADAQGRSVPSGRGDVVTKVDISGLRPRLWSPEHPNLYILKTRLYAGERLVGEETTRVGFRTFEARGNRLYLNGKVYFMRGANMPPHGLTPNDTALASKFMKLMHDGNEMATRTHMSPFTTAWLDAADKQGVGVSVEGTWPWLFLTTSEIPDDALLKTWKKEFLDLIRSVRNHPSVLMYTINNECYFEGGSDPDKERKAKKFAIYSDMAKSIRATHPSIPVVLHSGYARVPDDVEAITRNGWDDGDIDDRHLYSGGGWYGASPSRLDVAGLEKSVIGTRPFISQEPSTGYPDNDTGHAAESYLRKDLTPQAWVGQYSGYNSDPNLFLNLHAQLTKEFAEKIRRDRAFISGWLIFSNVCWFKDVYDAATIDPYPTYWAVRKAWQPTLVSLATPDRHFQAGATFTSDVYVLNDDPDTPYLRDLTLIWRIDGTSDDPGTSGVVKMPDCRYDGKGKRAVTFRAPSSLPEARADMTLTLELRSGDKVVSVNDYPLVCARPEWFSTGGGAKVVVLAKEPGTGRYLDSLGFHSEVVSSVNWSTADTSSVVVIDGSVGKSMLGSVEEFEAFVKRGGRALIWDPSCSSDLLGAIPGLDAGALKAVDTSGDYGDIVDPELQRAVDAKDMRWWNVTDSSGVRICRKAYQAGAGAGVTEFVRHIQPHGYLSGDSKIGNFTSLPVFAVKSGDGLVAVSSLIAADDPIARRFTAALLMRMAR